MYIIIILSILNCIRSYSESVLTQHQLFLAYLKHLRLFLFLDDRLFHKVLSKYILSFFLSSFKSSSSIIFLLKLLVLFFSFFRIQKSKPLNIEWQNLLPRICLANVKRCYILEFGLCLNRHQ